MAAVWVMVKFCSWLARIGPEGDQTEMHSGHMGMKPGVL